MAFGAAAFAAPAAGPSSAGPGAAHSPATGPPAPGQAAPDDAAPAPVKASRVHVPKNVGDLASSLRSLRQDPAQPTPEEQQAQGDPLTSIIGYMSDASSGLGQFRTDRPVQGKQQAAVQDLDVLIKKIEEEMKGGNGGGNPNPTRPMQASVIAKGPGGSGPLHDPHAGTKSWGELPAKEREQILQSQTEGFPAGFENVLASYYQRLAQEKVSDGSGDKPADASPTAPQGGQ